MTVNESYRGKCRDGHLWQAVVITDEVKKAKCIREGCNAEFEV